VGVLASAVHAAVALGFPKRASLFANPGKKKPAFHSHLRTVENISLALQLQLGRRQTMPSVDDAGRRDGDVQGLSDRTSPCRVVTPSDPLQVRTFSDLFGPFSLPSGRMTLRTQRGSHPGRGGAHTDTPYIGSRIG
jgi:hypothetical protein